MNPSRASTPTPGPDTAPAGLGCTCFRLRSLSRVVTQIYDRALAPSGLKVTQYSLIAHARRPRGSSAPSVSELAQALYTDRTTLTRNLKPLQESGLIEVGAGADSRSRAVCVTTKGEAAYQEARALWRAAQDRMQRVCGAEKIAQLHALAEELLPVLGRETA